MKEGMEKATKGLETSQLKLKEGVEKAMKTAEEMLSFSQGNMEAFIKASQIYAHRLPGHLQASCSFEQGFFRRIRCVHQIPDGREIRQGSC